MNHGAAEANAIVEPVRGIEKKNSVCGTASLEDIGFLKGGVDGGANSSFDLDACVSSTDFEFQQRMFRIRDADEFILMNGSFVESGLFEKGLEFLRVAFFGFVKTACEIAEFDFAKRPPPRFSGVGRGQADSKKGCDEHSAHGRSASRTRPGRKMGGIAGGILFGCFHAYYAQARVGEASGGVSAALLIWQI
jgi:hypothetical protein